MNAACAMRHAWDMTKYRCDCQEARNVGYYQDPKDQVAYNQDDDGDDELEVL